MNWRFLLGMVCFLPAVVFADEPKAPATVKELFADFDPRKDALDTKVVREWEKDGIVYRHVKAKQPKASLNLLWVMAAGLKYRDWRELSDQEKEKLRAE